MNIKHGQEIGTKRQNNTIMAYCRIKRRVSSDKQSENYVNIKFEKYPGLFVEIYHRDKVLIFFLFSFCYLSLPWKEPAKWEFTT